MPRQDSSEQGPRWRVRTTAMWPLMPPVSGSEIDRVLREARAFAERERASRPAVGDPVLEVMHGEMVVVVEVEDRTMKRPPDISESSPVVYRAEGEGVQPRRPSRTVDG